MKLKMQKISRLFKESEIIKNFEFTDFNSGSNFYYYKAKLILINSTILFIREYVSSTEHAYSYHWQDPKGKMIIRWDNSPHYKKLKTFPHHKHTPDIEESYETNISDIMKLIEKKLLK